MSRKNSRRDFLKTTAATGVGFWIAGRSEGLAAPGPNERLNVGVIGCGGRGSANLSAVAATENIVALCDVDDRRVGNAYTRFPKATRYSDYRQMLDRQRNLDAVVVSTPDHNHALATILALGAGKHVYCEKPLTHNVYEARQVKLTATRHRVATQMGNQGTSTDGLRRSVEIIRSGALGPVREVHCWTNRPIWPQNRTRPTETPPVPPGLNWDTWLGPAPERPYHSAYLPFSWRGWWDFGTGAIGDMACHTMNLPFMALRLGAPTAVSAVSSTPVNNESPPEGCTITYEFPARGDLPEVRLTWYERGRPAPALFHGQQPSNSGCLIVGQRGTLYSSSDYGDGHRLLPEEAFRDYQPPERTLPHSPGHHQEWLRACRGGPAAMSNFVDYSCQLTETALLGNVALRVGQRIVWDATNLRAVDLPAADQYIRRQYRQGWELPQA